MGRAYDHSQASKHANDIINLKGRLGPPMTLGNMRANGVCPLAVSCLQPPFYFRREQLSRRRVGAIVRPGLPLRALRTHRRRCEAKLG